MTAAEPARERVSPMTGRPPSSLRAQARAILTAAERDEAAEQAKLAALHEQERQLRRALDQAAAALLTAKGPEATRAVRAHVEEVERARDALVRTRQDQEQVTRKQQETTREVRNAVDDLDRRAARLRHAVRQAEQVVAARQRLVLEMEEELTRVREQLGRLREHLTDAQTSLEKLRQELAEVGE